MVKKARCAKILSNSLVFCWIKKLERVAVKEDMGTLMKEIRILREVNNMMKNKWAVKELKFGNYQ